MDGLHQSPRVHDHHVDADPDDGRDADGHGHHHHHHHHHHGSSGPLTPAARGRFLLRTVAAAVVVGAAALATTAVTVQAGQAVVVTRFGAPVRVLAVPGLGWKLPAPVEAAIPVDLRLRTTSTGLQDVGTRDGLRILVRAYVAWQVPAGGRDVRAFVRSVRNDADEAARQMRSLVGAALQVTASGFDLADLVNTDPGRVRLDGFQAALRRQVEDQLRQVYGIAVREVGIEHLGLPDTTLAATVSRMRSERETVAAERTADGLRQAAEIRAEAARDSRIEVARANTEAAAIEATSRREAADIQGRAYAQDPQLYLLLRSLDTLGGIVGPNTRIVLRTDAAPFDALSSGPGAVPVRPASGSSR